MRLPARLVGFLVLVVLLMFPGTLTPRASATTTCTFTVVGTTWYLNGNCTTDQTIFIPNGYTLEGQGYTITAYDPLGGHFVGAVVQNGGSVAYVRNLIVEASGLANVCDGGVDRLRGIMFDGASGSIENNTVRDINQGLSGCQEGNAIEVRNAPFDGTHPNTKTVVISRNLIRKYQKTGIVVNGDVYGTVTNNDVGSAELPENIAANSIQFGFGAAGAANNNVIAGNQWDVISTPQWVATAVLIYLAGDVNVNHNLITGAATDIGVAAQDSGTVNVMNNEIGRTSPGAGDTIDDYGIGVDFSGNSGKSKVVNNTFAGWNTAFSGEDLSRRNVVSP